MTRLAALIIVVFWFVMTLLLVRNEVSPDASRLREVPVAHVLKMLYLHEQPSDLTVFNGPTSIGSVRLHPRTDPGTQRRVLDLSGDLRVTLGAGQSTRVNWLGMLEMTPTYEIKRSKWTLTILDPGYLRAEIETPEGSKTARYTLRTRETSSDGAIPMDRVISEGELPVDKGGINGLAKQLNFGASLDVLTKQGQEQAAPIIRARQSSLRWRGEKTDTYLLTIEQSGQMLIEAHFSQLGQMLMARTVLGYTLRSSDLLP